MALRWGIASAGRISHDFVCAIHTHPTENHEVIAVAARTLETAREFADTHKISTALSGYEALAKLSNIDIVYIGVINTKHYDVARLMLENGKHVLCEKPLTMNQKETTELLDYAKSKKLFFMEAIWSRCFPVYHELRKRIDSGEIGEVLHFQVSFGFPLEHIARVNTKELGGGVILDIGIYTLQLAQYVFKNKKPTKFIGSGYLNKNGVDESASAMVHYPENKSAVLFISSLTEMPNEAVIIGTKGFIRVPMFWCPDSLITKAGTTKFDLPVSSDKYNFHNSVGLSYEAEECRLCIQKGLLESPAVSHADSIELAGLMDAWRKDVNVVA